MVLEVIIKVGGKSGVGGINKGGKEEWCGR